jgi:serine protease inhibitor
MKTFLAVLLITCFEGFSQTPKENAAAYNQFAIDFLKASYEQGQNFVVSPAGVYSNLSFLASGARKEMESQITPLLGPNHMSSAPVVIKKLKIAIKNNRLAFATVLWLENPILLPDTSTRYLTNDLYGQIFKVSAISSPSTCDLMRTWFGKFSKTSMAEPYKVKGSFITGNSVTLRGSWSHPFNPSKTTNDSFLSTGGRQIFVPTMHSSQLIGNYETENAKWCELGLNDSLAMIIVMPKKSYTVSDVIASFHVDILTNAKFSVIPTRLSIPKFNIQTSASLVKSLNSLGAFSLFNSFDGIVFFEDSRIVIGGMFNEASISVTEEGVDIERTASSPTTRQLVLLNVNRSFLFFVVTVDERFIILEGVVDRPDQL